ncbi:uncharacterized protein LACBIDRAFT_333616 [Laccaria bicolor S238N-H82]|uniref:Predicted protein n=1 Tax=Laccaria bicolor (strain S238N-H82 / ATCC MYA-4686) TaxID=486041 RepID=B0DWI4_LACBS|nr:uncharacterized protein LACBIDRAFT_333616 [Laccaria bicolor S238N-H82]EDR01095.1 predicted protein [Laccaria bicolor S238N-H82]|eukprot:XP_001888314.1 predicted protein [Laccaria bicolor S238N-H82]
MLHYFPHMVLNAAAHAAASHAVASHADKQDKHHEINAEDVLDHTDFSLIHNTKTFEDVAFLCIVTAIIAEHSFFLWKQKHSKSTAPYELAIQKLNSSVNLTKIKTAIEEASHMKTKDQKKQALLKIAMDNRFPHLPRIS